jgi:hypothetical protein
MLVALVAAALADVGTRLQPTWHDPMLPLFCGLASLQAMYVSQLRRGEEQPAFVSGMRGRVLEIISLAICRQIWVPVFGGRSLLWQHFPVLDLPAMTVSVALFLPIVAAWLIGARMAAAFDLIDEDARAPLSTLSAAADAGVWILCGGMVLAAADIVLKLPAARRGASAPVPSISVLLLVYALAAVILLGHIRISSLSARWRYWKPSVEPSVPRSWIRQGGLVTAVVLGAALTAPFAVRAVMAGVPFQNVFTFPSNAATDHATPDPPMPQVPDPWPAPQWVPPVLPGNQSWPRPAVMPVHNRGFVLPVGTLLKGLGLGLPWLLLLASVGYRLRRRGGRREAHRADVLQFVAELLRAAVQAFAALPSIVRRPRLPHALPSWTLTRQLTRSPGRHVPPPQKRRLRLPRRRTDRERVIRSYRAVVRGARDRGAATPPGQVPDELATVVAAMVQGTDDDMHALARSYVEARYSRRVVDIDGVRTAEAAARRLRALLR